jgi:hypothetical protein
MPDLPKISICSDRRPEAFAVLAGLFFFNNYQLLGALNVHKYITGTHG